MCDWRYSRDEPKIVKITKELLIEEFGNMDVDPPIITSETINYLNIIYKPHLDRLNSISTGGELIAYYVELSQNLELKNMLPGNNLTEGKEYLIGLLLSDLLWDRGSDELGITRNGTIINPWKTKDYVRNNKYTRILFNYNEEDDDIDYEDTSVTIPIVITLNGNKSVVELTYENMMGIMAVYRHLHLMHPLSYGDTFFEKEMEVINERAFDHGLIIRCYKYKVNVGNDIYGFDNLEFFQGLLTAANWNKLDPHTFITNLQQNYKNEIQEITWTTLNY
jgi:hypothetical protein